ncbi:Agamous-like MADS-box protein AGL62, partial [Mucuna pruriens]
MEGRKIKRKQKREIKKIENTRNLLITFTKRKYCIHKKANELSTLCGAKVDILMCTSSADWFSYGEPSHRAMTRCSGERKTTKDGINQLVQYHTKSKIDELNEKNNALMNQMSYEKEQENELVKILKIRNTCGWWDAKIQDLSYEQAKEMEASFVELKKKLENELSIKHGEKENVILVSRVNSCHTYTSGSNISEVVFGAKNEDCGIGASESILPNISRSPSNEEQKFNFLPYGERREDLFDIVYPLRIQARGDSYFVDDPNASSGKSAFTSPTKQTQGLNLTNASGSSNHILGFSSSSQSQKYHPFLSIANNQTIGRKGNYDFVFSPSNQYQDTNQFLCDASNKNAGGNDSDVLFASSHLNQQQGANPFIYIENKENGDFSFPPFNGYGHGYF